MQRAGPRSFQGDLGRGKAGAGIGQQEIRLQLHEAGVVVAAGVLVNKVDFSVTVEVAGHDGGEKVRQRSGVHRIVVCGNAEGVGVEILSVDVGQNRDRSGHLAKDSEVRLSVIVEIARGQGRAIHLETQPAAETALAVAIDKNNLGVTAVVELVEIFGNGDIEVAVSVEIGDGDVGDGAVKDGKGSAERSVAVVEVNHDACARGVGFNGNNIDKAVIINVDGQEFAGLTGNGRRPAKRKRRSGLRPHADGDE